MNKLIDCGVEVTRENSRDLKTVLQGLAKHDLQSVLVEGGTEIAGAFADAKLIDKLTFMVAPIVIGGHEAPLAIGGKGVDSLENALRLKDLKIINHGEDFEITGYPSKE